MYVHKGFFYIIFVQLSLTSYFGVNKSHKFFIFVDIIDF